jgi:glutamyl-tRNA synthetase
MNQLQQGVRVRFAPSPTGHLHIGGLRTALFNYFFAKKNNGSYLLRIEDTDIARSTDDFKQSIIDSFDWIGIQPDEPVVIQSSRFQQHMAIVAMLIAQNKAYRCYCTESMLQARIGKSEDSFVRYDRYCYNKPAQDNLPFVVRFLMESDDFSLYSFNDLIRDQITFQPDHFDDFIIVRSDGVPVYNLVVVIDDAFMKVSHVIRGEEHIPNTPKQIALYKACGYPVPQFAHLPMILGPEGQKLSKRDGAKSVYEYKNEGYLSDALVNYLVRLGWSYGDQEIFSKAELESFFTLESVGKKGAIFDQAKLDWMNGQYLKKMNSEDLFIYIKKFLKADFAGLYTWSHETLLKAIDLFKGRVVTVCDLINACDNIFAGPSVQKLEAHKHVFANDAICKALQSVQQAIKDDALNQEFLKKIALDNKLELVTLMQALRIALIGELAGPGVFDLIMVIGRQEALHRIIRFMAL